MQMLLKKNLIHIFRRALNLIDYRLVDHCERVTYIVHQMLLAEGKHTDQQLLVICYLCTLHDVGAYKKEMIDSLADIKNILSFELEDTMGHSIYGYLFIKNCSLLSEYASVVLYQHFPYEKLIETDCTYKDLAAKIFLADRLDMMIQSEDVEINESLFVGLRDSMFCGKDIDLCIELEKKLDIKEKLVSMSYMSELFEFYQKVLLPYDKAIDFLRTLIYLIDFRSEYTVTHTITTVGISVEIARLLGLPKQETDKIYYGSLLHDVGKIATSLMVLEKSERLDDYEYTMMKDHVLVSEYILKDYIDEEIVQIAIRHHEKIDGTGYPYGLTGEQLSVSQRIVGVADILSALVGKRSYKEAFHEDRIKSILQDMAKNNKLCKDMVDIVLTNYKEIIYNAEQNCAALLKNYHDMNEQYELMCKTFNQNK